jgi:hypothetical protein
MALSRTLQLVLLIALLSPATPFAQPAQEHWLVGVWEAPGRLIEVTSVQADGTAQGSMGIAGQGQGPARITVTGNRMRLVNAINNAFDMTLSGDDRMTGTVTSAKDGSVQPYTVTKRKRCTEPMAAGLESSAAPTYCLLDSWTFSTGNIERVITVSSDAYTFQGRVGGCGGCLVQYSRDLRPMKVVTPDGGEPNWMQLRLASFGRDWNYLDFPLTPKKTWRISSTALFSGRVAPVTVDATVVGHEEVRTKAGTFKAAKIQYDWKATFGGEGRGMASWTNTWWWSPETKSIVKFTTTTAGAQDWELVSYSLK